MLVLAGRAWVNLRFSIARTVYESRAIFFVPSKHVDLIRSLLWDDALNKLGRLYES